MALRLPACYRGVRFRMGVFVPLKGELKSVLNDSPKNFWLLFCVRTVAASKAPPRWHARDPFPAISGGGKC